MSGKSNAGIRTVDMRVLDKVFGMEDGYVLDFSNRTYAEFFREELRVDIDEPRWAVQGGSKAKPVALLLATGEPPNGPRMDAECAVGVS